jgi:hypothetical protein
MFLLPTLKWSLPSVIPTETLKWLQMFHLSVYGPEMFYGDRILSKELWAELTVLYPVAQT